MNWRKFSEEKPADQQPCLTIMKHGIIEGYYDVEDEIFYKYYWRDMQWWASWWMPIEEVDNPEQQQGGKE